MKAMQHIDIIVPTYNRQEDINRFVDEILKQDYPFFSVYFIDDCSNPPVILPKDSPKFNLIRLNKNEGQASARNYGIKAGKGDIIVSMDDDAWFLDDPSALSKIPSYFIEPSVGCVMFDVITPQDKWISDDRKLLDSQEIGSHITCSCAYRREAIEKIKGFNKILHSCAEETDLTLRLLVQGYKIIFGEKIKVFHNYVPTIRTNQWYRKFCGNNVRNNLIIILLYYPLYLIIPHFFGKFFSYLWYVVIKNGRDRWISGLYCFFGFFHVFVNIGFIIKNRQSVNSISFKKWLKIRW